MIAARPARRRISRRSRGDSRGPAAGATGRSVPRRLRAARRGESLRADLHGRGGIRRGNPQARRPGSAAQGANSHRRASDRTFSMICRTRLAVLAHDLGRAASARRERGGLRQELPRVTHRPDGIADLMRDARREPAETRELRLLHALPRTGSRPRGNDQRRRRGTLATERARSAA